MHVKFYSPRPNWQNTVSSLGLIWNTTNGKPYWDESRVYFFTEDQITVIEEATAELYSLFIQAGDHIVKNRLFGKFGIPEFMWDAITQSWNNEPPALNYGRFDLAWNGIGAPKLLEFNCDTPTSLLEAAVIQWQWKEEVMPDRDQFNSLHDKLVAKWRDIPEHRIHFTHASDATGEDMITVAYLRDTAEEAGKETIQVPIDRIGYDTFDREFVSEDGETIRALYKLYPWEWLVNEEFGKYIPTATNLWLEPVWKMIWSNKAILPILWELFPGHPNLLEARWTPYPAGVDCVKKPKLSREGANVEIIRDYRTVEKTEGDYGDEGYIWQELYELPTFDGGESYPIIGSWIVDSSPAGIGIREGGLITDNKSRFVPHVIVG